MNKHRGEALLELGGKQITLRPTFEALAAIEAETGKAIIEVYRELAQKTSFAPLVVAIVRSQEDEPRDKGEVWNDIIDAGALEVWVTCVEFLTAALGGGREEEAGEPTPGEVQAAVKAVKTLSAASKKSRPAKRSNGPRKRSGKARPKS